MKTSKGRATRRTVLIAGAANLFVAVVKLIAGMIAGSSVMLAEGAHSVADAINQGFLLASVHQAERRADASHPFGYGQERYFWSLLAAFGIFVAGAGFSVFEGVLALAKPASEGGGSPLVAYIVLGLAFCAEGTSWVRAFTQIRSQARRDRTALLTQVRSSPDTTVRAALFEDTAAVIGLVLAAGGLVLRQLTGSEVWDGAASIAIAVLLVAVAVKLGMDSRELLIGRAAEPAQQHAIREEVENTPGIDSLVELLTMHLGPDHLIVAGRVAFADDISADRAEDLADDIDRRLTERLPLTPHVFLDPTQRSGASEDSGRPAGG